MKYIWLVIFLILISMCVLTFAGLDIENKIERNKERIAQMAALNSKERIEFLGELCKERSDIQGNLIHQLGDASSKDIKFAAAFLLGIYRMEESVYSLSRNITLENENILQDNRIPLWERYPVVEALIRIGKPAVPEMLKNIQTIDDEKVRELSARVIRYVEGPEIGRIILEKTIEKQTDPQRKTKLEAALSLDYFKIKEEK